MDYNTEKPSVPFGDQRRVLRRKLWDQFIKQLDPYERERFYQLIAPYPRKRFEKALFNLLVVFGKADQILAESERHHRKISRVP
jgi:hypothetical protein